MVKGTEKSSPCMLSRYVVHLGILKWTRMRESSPSILKLGKSLSHLRNLRANLNITKMQNVYKCTLYRSSCKIESMKTKQTITNNDLVVDLTTKILDENINLNRIKKQFTIDGCKCLKKKKISKTKETAEWNCSVCKIDVHLYVSIVCDECLGWNHLKYVGLKAPPKSTNWLCR